VALDDVRNTTRAALPPEVSLVWRQAHPQGYGEQTQLLTTGSFR
jgi:hypothetical protein